MSRSKCFDPAKFLKSCDDLSVYSYVYRAPNKKLMVNFCYPISISKEDSDSLKKLTSWADREDPSQKMRRAFVEAVWSNRKPGEKFVPTCRKIS